jgi:hypothetical protein
MQRVIFMRLFRSVSENGQLIDNKDMETCTKAPELRTLANKIIKDKFYTIREQKISIGYCYSDLEKKKGKKRVYADIRKVPPVYKTWLRYDFVITFYEPNTMLMDEHQLEILMEHELRHIGITDNGDLVIEPHDIEDFRAIIDDYGLDWDSTEGEENGE